jgi:hypothetical protein
MVKTTDRTMHEISTGAMGLISSPYNNIPLPLIKKEWKKSGTVLL